MKSDKDYIFCISTIKSLKSLQQSLAETKIRNEIKQLSLKYKHGSNIHEHGKQQNE